MSTPEDSPEGSPVEVVTGKKSLLPDVKKLE